MLRHLPGAAGVLIAAIVLSVPHAADAQGNGRPKGTRPGTANSSAAPTTTAAPVTTYPQFGAWLDDASVFERGNGSVNIGAGHWRLDGMTQTNIPMVGAAIGVTNRVQFNASVPFYRVNAPGGSASGLDDVYLSGKVMLLDPTLTVSEVGVAVSPVLEVLSTDTVDGRVHFALPVSVEWRRRPVRVYGTAGYFTRGALFGGGAVEWTSPGGLSVTGSLMQSYSTKTPAVTGAATTERQHADATMTIAAPVARAVSVYGSVGRSLTSIQAGGASLAITGGVAFHFSAPLSAP